MSKNSSNLSRLLIFQVIALILVSIACSPQKAAFASNENYSRSFYIVNTEEKQPSYIITKGIGRRVSNRGLSKRQEGLMAKRAATIDAYRNLSTVYRKAVPYLANDSGTVTTTGYIKGASVLREDYLHNDAVEVYVGAPVKLKNPSNMSNAFWQNAQSYPFSISPGNKSVISENTWKTFFHETY